MKSKLYIFLIFFYVFLYKVIAQVDTLSPLIMINRQGDSLSYKARMSRLLSGVFNEVETKVLVDVANPFAQSILSQYTGYEFSDTIPLNFSVWKNLYYFILNGVIDENNILPTIQEIDSIANRKIKEGTIPIIIGNFYYQSIHNPDSLIENGIVQVSTSGLLNHVRKSIPIFDKKHTFIVSSSKNEFYQNTIKFLIDNKFIIKNTNDTPQKILINFDNNLPWIEFDYSWNNKEYLITYSVLGTKIIKIKYVLNTSDTLYSSFIVNIKSFSPPVPNDVWGFYSYIPYIDNNNNSHYAYGKAYILYGCNHTKLVKPIIISDGFDPGNKRNYAELYYMLNQASLLENLLAEGYDVIIADYEYGDTYIQANALAFVHLIQTVNYVLYLNYNSDYKKHKITIVGPSMGGLIAKYALAYMEQHNMEHNCKLYISFDAPHLGANVPLGDQYALHFLNTNAGNNDTQEALNILNSPAASQMLIYHYNAYPNTHSNRTTLINDPYYLFPNKCKKISIINGDGNGNILYPSCQIMINSNYNASLGINILKIITRSVPDAPNGWCKIFEGHLKSSLLSSVSQTVQVANTLPYDGAPGGYENINEEIGNAIANSPALQNYNGSTTIQHSINCFIPTVSALSIKNIHPYTNISNLFGYSYSTYLYPPNHSLTPFDAIYFSVGGALNSEHISIDYYGIYDVFSNEISPNSLVLQDQVITDENLFEARYDIYIGKLPSGNFIVNPPSNIDIHAGQRIILHPGTYFNNGSHVKLYIEPYQCCASYYFDNTDPSCSSYRQFYTSSKYPLPYENSQIIMKSQKIQNFNNYRTNKHNLIFFPNPTSSSISIQTLDNSRIQRIRIKDLTGKILLQENFSAASNTATLDVSTLSNGLYLCEIHTNNSVVTEKIVVQK
ncbi:MAG: hypothetical protein KatS3mg027_2463 [Bacteroidia bacterium]|nr:MAG: hypothetical protein KatS3mg027_2463 [Bacteroidia bacterium]